MFATLFFMKCEKSQTNKSSATLYLRMCIFKAANVNLFREICNKMTFGHLYYLSK